jgi:hypothetical protein
MREPKNMAHELPIPSPAESDPRSVEMIRLWLANQKLHCVLNIGFWQDRGLDERNGWGILLADMIHHIANAHQSEYGRDPRETIIEIRHAFEAEMENPTSSRLGDFVNPSKTNRT